ncbi:MAG: helix-turn-helix domain-containing protein [Clostridia bacterium]|nr:helix-turn-helix domain-containing protein [Clostridia bacterium]
MNSIGRKITTLRKQANITQDGLAEALDVTRQSVSQWESDTVIPKADKLKALCEYFNVKPDYFLFENSEFEPLVRTNKEIASAELSEEQSRKKTVFIISAVIISLLAAAIVFFIAWLASAAAAELSEYVVICLQVLSCIILLTVLSILIALIVKYKRNI